MRRHLFVFVGLVISAIAAAQAEEETIVVGSKTFTENVVLGEIATQLARDAGHRVEHRAELGGSRVLWSALIRGDVDIYPDYSGTLLYETLAAENLADMEALRAALADRGLALSPRLGFNNTYVMAMRRDRAAALDIETIGDLVDHPDLAFGFSNEFLDRADGWQALKARYALPQTNVNGLQHDLAYRGIAEGAIDLTDAYSTDPELAMLDLALLEDTRGHFPRYDAYYVYRADLAERAPDFIARLQRMQDRISETAMQRMNVAVKIDGRSEAAVAARMLEQAFAIEGEAITDTSVQRVARRSLEHLGLVAISLSAAIALAVPLGVVAARNEKLGRAVLGVTGILQTIPSLALFVFMIPLLGIGARPAIAALFLYSLLPIVRNTHAGLVGIAPALAESATTLGLTRRVRLWKIELPLALPSILAGIKTAAVINVGAATLGALIGAGGYGQPILTGIRLDDMGLILEGAIPAAGLALLITALFDGIERLLTPRGLKAASATGKP